MKDEKNINKKNKKYLLLFLIVLAPLVNATNYSDVMLVTNLNSANSIEISNYFVQMRNITKQCNISVTDVETVTFTYFNGTIRPAIENCIVSNGWNTSINYIVLTKGIPIRFPVTTTTRDGSVDSALTIILSSYSGNIGSGGNNSLELDGKVDNPMFNQTAHANKSYYDIYIVTRLDGYTAEDAKRLVTANVANPLSGNILLDRDPTKAGGYLYWDVNINTTRNTLLYKNYTNIIFNDTTDFLVNYEGLSGYASWGSNDANNPTDNSSMWNISFIPGSIGETAVSTSGRTFNKSIATYGQSLIADFIEKNISGIKGYVYEPILWAIAYPNVLFDRYTDNYTLGESFYMASDYINWMDIVIGDPKLSIYEMQSISVNVNQGISVGSSLWRQSVFYRGATTGIDFMGEEEEGSYTLINLSEDIALAENLSYSYYDYVATGVGGGSSPTITSVTSNQTNIPQEETISSKKCYIDETGRVVGCSFILKGIILFFALLLLFFIIKRSKKREKKKNEK